MKDILQLVERWKEHYSQYVFKVVDHTKVVVSSPTNYKDLSGWEFLDSDLTFELSFNEEVKQYDTIPMYREGIKNWDKNKCYIEINIKFM
jgi:hypothetical protein